MNFKPIFLMLCVIGVTACSNNPRLGTAMTLVKNEQVYNPNATEENKGVIPEGSGERAQSTIEGYNKGSSKNITIEGFQL
ncbi:hypothetical protein A9264_08400 [Vibrio sp. UCD-FRSSP16_10]|uniref:hypothetical protein n=1 Tax=unclassified Vibrio TaxID=2614977 RepID=UPI0007FE847E|nr:MULTISPECIES: hypothetical protein [unclassified Vibrio]OBT06584.1 hypothetical protein A9260_09185 [Vibrio sp. UCD-FRSSP16_30]OBT12281.1 hypothetical protein A9264_08400 [Vibrio sp. UCD-FRSSP16_10]